MPEIKHTPGPWRIVKGFMGEIEIESDNDRDNADDSQVYVLARDIGGKIHGETFDDYSEQEANVSLIAAAPDMLADLVEAAATLRRYETLHRAKGTDESTAKAEFNAALATRFEATIAKATQPLNPA
jgi:hypothetical protein